MLKNKHASSGKVICPGCKSLNTDKWGRISFEHRAYSENSSLYLCLKCGLYFIYPSPDEKLLSKIYSGPYHHGSSRIYDLVAKVYTLLFDYKEDLKLIKFYGEGGRVLDIGAGKGDLISSLSPDIYEKWVYDPYLSKEDIKILSNKITRINNHVNLSEYPNGYFDLVILRNVIEHTASFRILIKEIYKKLKKGGIVFIRTPNIDSVDFKIFRTDWYEVRMPGHIVFFNRESMQNVLVDEGLHILHNKATKRSMPFSFSRSVDVRIFTPFRWLFSLLFSFLSPFMGEGGELLTVARK